jgi:hypothetical protein
MPSITGAMDKARVIRFSVRGRTGRPDMIADSVGALTPERIDKSAAVQPRRASSNFKLSALTTMSIGALPWESPWGVIAIVGLRITPSSQVRHLLPGDFAC